MKSVFPVFVVELRESPSSRRAWIEIKKKNERRCTNGVALLAEGVD